MTVTPVHQREHEKEKETTTKKKKRKKKKKKTKTTTARKQSERLAGRGGGVYAVGLCLLAGPVVVVVAALGGLVSGTKKQKRLGFAGGGRGGEEGPCVGGWLGVWGLVVLVLSMVVLVLSVVVLVLSMVVLVLSEGGEGVELLGLVVVLVLGLRLGLGLVAMGGFRLVLPTPTLRAGSRLRLGRT